jgi:hypothetical protein
MKIILAIAAFALVSTSMSTPVQAWELVEKCTYSKFFGKTCRTTYYEDEARNPAQELEDQRARRASIEKWEGFCRPQRTYDNLGVTRLVYAHRGCEFGRSE